MGAALGIDRNVAQTFGAFFRCGFGGGFRMDLLQEFIDGQHHEKINGYGDDDKRNERVQKIADKEFASVQREADARKIRRFDERGDERSDKVFYERGHDAAECGANDHADRKIDRISPKDEFLESFQHTVSIAR